jgi:hypothetical protein
MEVTDEAAPTTPEITLFFIVPGMEPFVHLAPTTSTSSILLIDPERQRENPGVNAEIFTWSYK